MALAAYQYSAVASVSSWAGAQGGVGSRIENNLIHDNGKQGIDLIGSGLLWPTVVNNTIVDNGGAGIQHVGARPTIRNNLIAHNAWGLRSIDGMLSSESQITNNLVYGNVSGSSENHPAWFGDVTTVNRTGVPADIGMNIFASPEFVDTDTYRVNDLSPAIDAGTDLSAPAMDIDGDQRLRPSVFGNREVDIGTNPIDVGYDEVLPPRTVSLDGRGDTYEQNFNSPLVLGQTGSAHLPTGWFVNAGGKTASIVTEHLPTNQVRGGAYNAGDTGQNAGDRGLAIGSVSDGMPAEIIFEATINSADVHAARILFDVETWAADPVQADNPGKPEFAVSLEKPRQGGFASVVVDMGRMSTNEVLPPDSGRGTGTFTDGKVQGALLASPTRISTADVDGDNDLDLILSSKSQT